ncbi:chromosome segregation protein SMC [Candidatus Thiomargarita nelsonii]|uniref:Chromosome segregation protein SMC n=1 Tax=Candidatus Thiomargarita nelsonii TaxID=1003181 RepID=A0A4E0QQN5_9GAMM|nr:chromosome segregation protein SMC [Candidatus Thiomargarita nelsonii]
MKIESISLKNFKTFQSAELKDIPPMCVIVGANGSGKSTLFDVFNFIKDAMKDNVQKALSKRGGFKEVVSRGHENEQIELKIQFRMPVANVQRLVTYQLQITLKNNRPIIKREVLRYKRGAYGSPYHFLDFQYGKGYAITNEEDFNKPDEQLDREEQTLDSPNILAIKGLGQFKRFKAATAFRQLIESWNLSDFKINQARQIQDDGYAEHLSSEGENLSLVAQFIYEEHRDIFDKILSKLSERVPGIHNVKAKTTEEGRVLLKFQDSAFKDPFLARYVSDGTIKMFAYLILLHEPSPHPLLCVEEPENQLYPDLLYELAEEFRLYSLRGGQVMVSSHSPDFLNAIELDEIFWLVKKDGYTTIRRAREVELVSNLVKGGDKPGWVWKKGLFEGANPK